MIPIRIIRYLCLLVQKKRKSIGGVLVCILVAAVIPILYQALFLDKMSSTVSTWYYIVSSLGIYHSYTPVLNMNMGKIKGVVSVSRGGREFYEYRGIPYALAPEGPLRFEPPVPFREGWGSTVFNATTFGPPCLQFDAMVSGEVLGEEDCLKLNVFTPNVTRKTRMPVIVYIIGGGFTSGDSSIFNPKFFMDHDIVFVTFNYRLASLGFLNTCDLVKGNMGLKDQNMVLQWVRDNIEDFGGDPNKVTLMGESAGGASVHYHVLSPLSRGLFNRAVIQSGTVGSPWSLTRDPKHQALRFGKILGCPTDNTSALVQCLKNMDAKEIVKTHEVLMSPTHLQDDFFPGSVEAVSGEDTFLPENPHILLQNGDFARIPILLGINSGEGALKTARLEAYPEILENLNSKWNEIVPILLHYDPNRADVSEKLRNYYFTKEDENGTLIPTNPFDDLTALTRMISMGIFFEGTHRAAEIHAKWAPTFLYYYTYLQKSVPSTYAMIRAARKSEWYSSFPVTVARGLGRYYWNKMVWPSSDPSRFGAIHGDDIMQAFSMNPLVDVKTSSSDYPFSKMFVSMLVQFASEDLDQFSFNSHLWPPADPQEKTLEYMEVNSTGGMIKEPFEKDLRFFESLNIRDPLDPHNW